MPKASRVWQASEARNNFTEVMRSALAGHPQTVRHRNGEEVVVVAKPDYDAMKPTLKTFLTSGGTCRDDDALEKAIAANRAEGITMLGVINVG